MSNIAKIALSPVLALAGAFNKPKPVAQTMPATRNAAAEAAMRDDELRRRRGAGANELTGGGAEAVTPGAKTLLGQ
ncbi:hypothetical protein ACMT1E_04375 [Sphingomonas flavalba]|uniref:hypothetical protein n=1 Tax=Sphingomonas flavalba TaxID=2559804 RepID=UPI0039DFFF24